MSAPASLITPRGRSDASAEVRFGGTDPLWLSVLQRLDLPVVVLTLFACLLAYDEALTLDYAAVALAGLVLTGRCVTPPDLRKTLIFGTRPPLLTTRLALEWATVIGILLMIGFALKVSELYSRKVILTWFAVTPFALLLVQSAQSRTARWLGEHYALAPSYVIVGANPVGAELARRLRARSFRGFFDFREPARLESEAPGLPVAGHCRDLGAFVRANAVASVYVALPITNSPRVRRLLDELRDTTASVYFVPDVFAFDLIQARIVDLNGMPAFAVCDTPLHGINSLAKRATDLSLGLAALLALAPLMLAIALAIKLSSPGPVLFRQRRYGLNGECIVVYKFRSMRVCEDAGDVRQASRHDERVTALGRFLRRTSLDELPQLLNVVGGSMSLVGPRPHAVAHNELYRSLISGYMIRHKVRPGITGWAQVHGLRGETDTIDKMERRVHYDLDYLNNWSLMLDFRILVRTARIVFGDRNAY